MASTNISLGFTPYNKPTLGLEPLKNTISTLDTRHLATIQQEAAMQKVASEFYSKVNPVEQGKVLNIFREYTDALNEDIERSGNGTGYEGNSLAKAVKLGAKLGGDPRLIGRVQAQIDYSGYQTELEKLRASGYITDLTYKRMLVMNPYYYADKKFGETDDDARKNRALEIEYNNDPQGYIAKYGEAPKNLESDIVGGTKWQPLSRPYKHYDFSTIVDKAMKHVQGSSGGYEKVMYLDAKGNPTDDFNKSVDKEWYSIQHGEWTKLGKDKIYSAIWNEINANNEFKQSLYQDYDDLYFDCKENYDKYDKGGDFLNEQGIPRGRNEYIDRFVKTYSKNMAVNNNKSSFKFNEKALEALHARQNGAGDGSDIPVANLDFMDVSSQGTPINLERVYKATEFRQNMLKCENDVEAYWERLGITDDIVQNDPRITNPVDRYNLNKLIQEYNENKSYYDKLMERINDPELYDAIEFQASSGSFNFDPNNQNRFSKEISKFIIDNDLSGDAKLRLYFKDDESYNKFKEATNIDYTLAKELANIKVERGVSNNYDPLFSDIPQQTKTVEYSLKYLDIPIEDYSSLYVIGKAIDEGKYNPDDKYNLFKSNRLPIDIIDDDRSISGSSLKRDKKSDPLGFIKGMYSTYKKTQDIIKNYEDDDEKTHIVNTIGSPNLPGEDWTTQSLKRVFDRGLISPEQYAKYDKELKEDLKRKLPASLVNYEIWSVVPDEDDPANKSSLLTSQDKIRLSNKLDLAVAENRVVFSPSFNIAGHGDVKYGTNIKILPKADSSGNITRESEAFYVVGLFESKAANAVMEDTANKAFLDYQEHNFLGTGRYLTNGLSFFDNCVITPNAHVAHQRDNATIKFADGFESTISATDAVKIIESEIILKDARNRLMTIGIPEDKLISLCDYITKSLSGVTNLSRKAVYYDLTGRVLNSNEE